MTQDETVRHVEAVERAWRAEDADVALVRREVGGAFHSFFSARSFYIDNLKLSETFHEDVLFIYAVLLLRGILLHVKIGSWVYGLIA